MAKSKKNVINPEDLIARYGADTARWYIISDSPPERDVEWTTTGVEAASKHLQRVLRLTSEIAESSSDANPDADARLKVAVHRAIDEVTRGIETFAFNKSVAKLYELFNTLGKSVAGSSAKREAMQAMAVLMAPVTPHLSEQMWSLLGGEGLVVEQSWPIADPEVIAEDSVVIPIQVNGKRRSEIRIPRGMESAKVERLALEDAAVARILAGRPPKKLIVVPERIVNVVA